MLSSSTETENDPNWIDGMCMKPLCLLRFSQFAVLFSAPAFSARAKSKTIDFPHKFTFSNHPFRNTLYYLPCQFSPAFEAGREQENRSDHTTAT